MSEFSRGKEFTASGLSYWVRQLASESGPPAKSLRLARVVRRHGGTAADPAFRDMSHTDSAAPWLVVESGALRVQVSERLDGGRLEAVLVAVQRAAKVGGA